MQESLATIPAPISAASVMSKTWALLQEKYPIIILVILWHATRNIVITAVILAVTVSNPNSPVIALSAILLLSAVSYAEFLSFSLILVRNENFNLFHLPRLSSLFSWLLAAVFSTFVVLLGTAALILPGLALGIFFSTTGYAAIDGFGPIQSLKLSWRIASSAFWQMTLIFLALLILILLPTGLAAPVDVMLIISLAIFYNTSHAYTESVKVKHHD